MRGEGYSLSDIAAATGNSNNNDGGFGGNNGWWIVLILLFAFNGWNGNRGNNGGGSGDSTSTLLPYLLAKDSSSSVQPNYTLTSDFGLIDRKLDAISSGICDATFALNNTATNGFANVQQTLCQGFGGLNQAITQNGYETRLGVQGLSSQLANCCCDIRQQIADCCCTTQRGIDGVNYNMAMNTNALQNTMCNNTRDILENNNNNTRAILDFLTQDKISTLQSENQALKFQASQTNQNAVLRAAMDANTAEIIRRTGNDCPVPAYVVQPSTPVSFPTNCCGQFNGYNGCNSGCGNY